jgi:hypothetical protein
MCKQLSLELLPAKEALAKAIFLGTPTKELATAAMTESELNNALPLWSHPEPSLDALDAVDMEGEWQGYEALLLLAPNVDE